MKDCPELQQLEAFHAGALGQEQADSLRAHLATCSDCASLAAKLSSHAALAARLREAVATPGQLPVGDSVPRSGSSAAYGLAGKGEPPSAGAADRFAGYRIVAEIARTHFSIVYEAIQEGTGQRVALKVLLATAAADDKSRRRFEREVELLASLQHPRIVPIFDSGLAGGQYYFVMPFIAGRPPDEHVEAAACSFRERLCLLRDICRAVGFAHQRGVIHRDLKPSNILVGDDGGPHILDFGLAKILADKREGGEPTLTLDSGEILWTPAYMSPEQAAGAADEVDMRSDVYSLGVVVYRTLTGQMPYPTDGGLVETLRHVQETEPCPPSKLEQRFDREVEAIVLKALAKERERRYQTAGALADDIERWLCGEPVDARRDHTLYLLRKIVRRHRRAVGGLAAVLLLAIAAGAWYVGETRRHQRANYEFGQAISSFELAEKRQDPELLRRGLRQLDRAIASDPRFSVGYFVRGMRKLGRTHPYDSDSPEHREYLAHALDDLDAAHRVAGRVGFPVALVEAGDALRRRGDQADEGGDESLRREYYDGAARYYERARLAAPGDVSVEARHVMLRMARRDPLSQWADQLEALLASPVARHQFDAEGLSRFGIRYFYAQQYQPAERLLLRAVEMTDEAGAQAGTYDALCQVYYDQGRFDEAREAIEQAVQLEPSAARWQRVAATLARLGRAAGAESASLQALGMDPEFRPAQESLVAARMTLGRYADAIRDYQPVVEKRPSKGGWRRLANAYAKLDDLQGAERSVRNALALEESDPLLHDMLAAYLWRQGRFDECREHSQRAAELRGKSEP